MSLEDKQVVIQFMKMLPVWSPMSLLDESDSGEKERREEAGEDQKEDERANGMKRRRKEEEGIGGRTGKDEWETESGILLMIKSSR